MGLFVNILFFLVLIVMSVFVVKIITETVKLRRNPIPKMQNHDKRFSEIKNEYLHKMYSIKLR